ncbi:hypothetical protein SALBM311S_04755 [Streptomyces alboniger]
MRIRHGTPAGLLRFLRDRGACRQNRGRRDGEAGSHGAPSVPYESLQFITPAANPHGGEVRHLTGRGSFHAERPRGNGSGGNGRNGGNGRKGKESGRARARTRTEVRRTREDHHLRRGIGLRCHDAARRRFPQRSVGYCRVVDNSLTRAGSSTHGCGSSEAGTLELSTPEFSTPEFSTPQSGTPESGTPEARPPSPGPRVQQPTAARTPDPSRPARSRTSSPAPHPRAARPPRRTARPAAGPRSPRTLAAPPRGRRPRPSRRPRRDR